MSSDSRRTSRCFSWMSLNQSTSMSSSRPSGSRRPQGRGWLQVPSSEDALAVRESPGHPQGPPPGPPSSPRTIHAAAQLLLQQNPAELQGVQLALDGVHLSVDVLLRDVLVGLDLPDSARVTTPPARLLPGASPLLRPAAASVGPGPGLCPTPWGQRQDPWVGKSRCGTAATPPCPAPAPTGAPRGRHNLLSLVAALPPPLLLHK